MKFKLGDFVRFVDEKREGFITRIIDNLTVGVTDTDGFEIPVALSNLTTVHGHTETLSYTADGGGVQKAQGHPAPPAAQFRAEGIFLLVSETAKVSPAVHFHILNESSYQLLLSWNTQQKGVYQGAFAGIIPAGGRSQIFAANLADIDLWPSFTLQLLFFTDSPRSPKAPFVWEKKFRAKDFSGPKEKIESLNQYGWRIRIDEAEVRIDPQQLKESFFSSKNEGKATVLRPPEEVDLHIESLRDDHHFLSSTEILNIQLAYFQQMLDAALVHRLPRMIFIHGVGNGTLRHELHRIISKHPQVRTFMDAQKQKFGYGATEVIFKV